MAITTPLGHTVKINSQGITTNSPGVTMINPPTIGQSYYDSTTGMTMLFTNTGWLPVSSAQIKNTPPIVTFKTADGRSVTMDEIVDFMEVMKRRMLVITPDFEKHEKFPALKEAYTTYLMIERLISSSPDDDTDQE